MPNGGIPVSIVSPTFMREKPLLDAVNVLTEQVMDGDEILLVDQTPAHEPSVEKALRDLESSHKIRWIRKRHPNQAQAMNVGALMARNPILLFLDDDIVPSHDLLRAHREAFQRNTRTVATFGQVLQPWQPAPVSTVRTFELGFNPAYDKPCEIVDLMFANFAILRDVFSEIGGVDENFGGSNYRNDSEVAHRLYARTGKKIAFLPQAGVRHLHADGGNRAFGHKDSWGAIGGSIGDYYFAIRSLRFPNAVGHCVKRLFREPVNRRTLVRPWMIGVIFVREIVAFCVALTRCFHSPDNYLKSLASYSDLSP